MSELSGFGLIWKRQEFDLAKMGPLKNTVRHLVVVGCCFAQHTVGCWGRTV